MTRFADLLGLVTVGSSAYTYDGAGRVTNIQHQNPLGGVLANYTYTYDLAKRLFDK